MIPSSNQLIRLLAPLWPWSFYPSPPDLWGTFSTEIAATIFEVSAEVAHAAFARPSRIPFAAVELASRSMEPKLAYCMYGHTYSKSVDEPGKGCQSCSWSAEEGKWILPCPRSRLRIWSRKTGSAVPSRASLLISILRLNIVLTYGIPPEFLGGVNIFLLNRHTPSSQSRFHRVTQLCADGIDCRESAGTGPINRKVVPNECCLGRSPWTN